MEMVLTIVVIAVIFLYVRTNNLRPGSNVNSSLEMKMLELQKEIEALREDTLETKIRICSLESKINTSIEERRIESVMKSKTSENSTSVNILFDSNNSEQTSPFRDSSKRIKKWLLIKMAMDMNTVKEILGNPHRISDIRGNSLWHYDDGTIQFSSKTAGVIDCDYNFSHPSKDLSRCEEIKQGITKTEVVKIMGDPYGVAIEAENNEDASENWHYFDDVHMVVVYYDHAGKVYEFTKQTRKQVVEEGEKTEKELGL